MIGKNEALASLFDECARLLRAHRELFDDAALENVGAIAALSARVVRLSARREPLVKILRDVSGLFFHDLAYAAGVGEKASRAGRSADRVVAGLLAGTRRGYLAAVERAMAAERRRHPLYLVSKGERLQAETSCPRCGVSAFRNAEELDACSECGYEFEPAPESAER